MSEDGDFKIFMCACKLSLNIPGDKKSPKEIPAAEHIIANDWLHLHDKNLQEHTPSEDCSYIQHIVDSGGNGFAG